MTKHMHRKIIWLTRRTAQGVTLCLETVRIALMIPFLMIGLRANPKVFHADHYRSSHPKSRLAQRFPKLHFVLFGTWQMQDPHPAFDTAWLASTYPRLILRPPVLNHVLNVDADRDYYLPSQDEEASHSLAAPAEAGDEEERYATGKEEPRQLNILDELWPTIEADGRAMADCASSITPTSLLRKHMAGSLDHAETRYADRQREAEAILTLMAQFPERVDHLVIMPWLGIRGGSERLQDRYFLHLRQRYPESRLCIFLPEEVHHYSRDEPWLYGIPTVAINDVLPEAEQESRMRILDRVLINLRPRSLHIMNSYCCWHFLMGHPQHISHDTKIFANIYSDIRSSDDMPVTAYHGFLYQTVEHLSGVFADNHAIVERTRKNFRLADSQMRKFHAIPTPILGLNGGDPSRDLRRFRRASGRRSLWVSRLAEEKRLDVLGTIAAALPERRICAYGSQSPRTKPDLTCLDQPNITLCGPFDALDNLPLDSFDSYIFTSRGEGMPLAVLEAIMLGLPVIAPDVGGIGEIITPDTGWLVSHSGAVDEYVAALKQIESDPDEAERRVENAQALLVERHSFSNFIATLEAVPGYIQVEE